MSRSYTPKELEKMQQADAAADSRRDFGSNAAMQDMAKDEDEDEDWLPPTLSLHGATVAAAASDPRSPEWGSLARDARSWDPSRGVAFETEFGPAAAHRGRADQPMVTTRRGDYDEQSVGHTYREILAALAATGASDQAVAQALFFEDPGYLEVNGAAASGRGLNAAAKLMCITQFAEERRNHGSGELFLAILQFAMQGQVGLSDLIFQSYLPAKQQGTRLMREWLASGESNIPFAAQIVDYWPEEDADAEMSGRTDRT